MNSIYLSQSCSTFKNIDNVWNFQLEDVTIQTSYCADTNNIISNNNKISADKRKRGAKETRKDEEVDYLWVKSLKLTIADERLYTVDKSGKADVNNNKYRRK